MRRWIAKLVVCLVCLVCGAARADQAPGLGDEGLEPHERRAELEVGATHLTARYRQGFYHTGLSWVGGVQTAWGSGFSTATVGLTQRFLGGYPARLVLRLDGGLGFGPRNGPSLGLALEGGAAVELGREGRRVAVVGVAAPLSLFVLPETAVYRGVLVNGGVSFPVNGQWRVGLGGELGSTQLVASAAGVSALRYDVVLGVARWF